MSQKELIAYQLANLIDAMCYYSIPAKKRIANALDESDQLDKLLDKLTNDDAQSEGNSI